MVLLDTYAYVTCDKMQKNSKLLKKIALCNSTFNRRTFVAITQVFIILWKCFMDMRLNIATCGNCIYSCAFGEQPNDLRMNETWSHNQAEVFTTVIYSNKMKEDLFWNFKTMRSQFLSTAMSEYMNSANLSLEVSFAWLDLFLWVCTGKWSICFVYLIWSIMALRYW